jgi:hypothetical protein
MFNDSKARNFKLNPKLVHAALEGTPPIKGAFTREGEALRAHFDEIRIQHGSIEMVFKGQVLAVMDTKDIDFKYMTLSLKGLDGTTKCSIT